MPPTKEGEIAMRLLDKKYDEWFSHFNEEQRDIIEDIRLADECYSRIQGSTLTLADIEYYFKKYGFSNLIETLKQKVFDSE